MAVVREPRSAHEDMKSIIQQSPAISFSMGWDKITRQSKAFLRDSDNGFFSSETLFVPDDAAGGCALNVEYITCRSSCWGVEHWSRGTGLRPASGTDLPTNGNKYVMLYRIIEENLLLFPQAAHPCSCLGFSSCWCSCTSSASPGSFGTRLASRACSVP